MPEGETKVEKAKKEVKKEVGGSSEVKNNLKMKEKRHFYINILTEKLADLLSAVRPNISVDNQNSEIAKIFSEKFWELDLNKTKDTAQTYDKYLIIRGTELKTRLLRIMPYLFWAVWRLCFLFLPK